MKKKRILLIMHLPPPVHGASISNQNLFNSKLIKSQFQCDLINFQFETSVKKLKTFSFKKVFKSFYYAFKIIKKISYKRPDLIYYTISPIGYSFYRDAIFVSIIKAFKIKIVFHLHGKGIRESANKSRLKGSIYKYVFSNCNIICLTKNLIKDVENIANSEPYIVPYGIPFGPVFEKNENKKEPVNILYVSNFIESKGILKLIDALKIIKDEGVLFSAKLVGAPSDLSVDYISEYIKSKSLGSFINVLGPRYNEEKFQEFHNADIFVFPTYYENETFGIVNLEAMQYNLPIISSNEGGIPEIVIDKVTGFIINPRDVNQLADKLRLLIENDSLRKEMGKKSNERFLKNYTLEQFECNMRDVFEKILAVN